MGELLATIEELDHKCLGGVLRSGKDGLSQLDSEEQIERIFVCENLHFQLTGSICKIPGCGAVATGKPLKTKSTQYVCDTCGEADLWVVEIYSNP